jgi:hypothetical protein
MIVNPRFDCKYLKLRKPKYNYHIEYFEQARDALSYIAKSCAPYSERKVGIPEYICDVVPEAFKKCGWIVKYFASENYAEITTKDLDPLENEGISLLLIPHYFGILQKLDPITSWCRKHNIYLIEDCAHLPLVAEEEPRYGNYGDAAIFSLRKFSPYCIAVMRINNMSMMKNDCGEKKEALYRTSVIRKIKEKVKKAITEHTNFDMIMQKRKNNYLYLKEILPSSSYAFLHEDDQCVMGALAFPIKLNHPPVGTGTGTGTGEIENFGYFWPRFPKEIDNQSDNYVGNKVFLLPIHQSLTLLSIERYVSVLRQSGMLK